MYKKFLFEMFRPLTRIISGRGGLAIARVPIVVVEWDSTKVKNVFLV